LTDDLKKTSQNRRLRLVLFSNRNHKKLNSLLRLKRKVIEKVDFMLFRYTIGL